MPWMENSGTRGWFSVVRTGVPLSDGPNLVETSHCQGTLATLARRMGGPGHWTWVTDVADQCHTAHIAQYYDGRAVGFGLGWHSWRLQRCREATQKCLCGEQSGFVSEWAGGHVVQVSRCFGALACKTWAALAISAIPRCFGLF